MTGVVVDLTARLPLRLRGPIAAPAVAEPTMICPICQLDSFTQLLHHYLGKPTVWWCSFCRQEIPPLSLVRQENA